MNNPEVLWPIGGFATICFFLWIVASNQPGCSVRDREAQEARTQGCVALCGEHGVILYEDSQRQCVCRP